MHDRHQLGGVLVTAASIASGRTTPHAVSMVLTSAPQRSAISLSRWPKRPKTGTSTLSPGAISGDQHGLDPGPRGAVDQERPAVGGLEDPAVQRHGLGHVGGERRVELAEQRHRHGAQHAGSALTGPGPSSRRGLGLRSPKRSGGAGGLGMGALGGLEAGVRVGTSHPRPGKTSGRILLERPLPDGGGLLSVRGPNRRHLARNFYGSASVYNWVTASKWATSVGGHASNGAMRYRGAFGRLVGS